MDPLKEHLSDSDNKPPLVTCHTVHKMALLPITPTTTTGSKHSNTLAQHLYVDTFSSFLSLVLAISTKIQWTHNVPLSLQPIWKH